MAKTKTFALLVATLTKDGHLLSNLHFEIDCIGNERYVWSEFYKRADGLHYVDLFDSISAPFARGVNPESGFVEVYRIQQIN